MNKRILKVTILFLMIFFTLWLFMLLCVKTREKSVPRINANRLIENAIMFYNSDDFEKINDLSSELYYVHYEKNDSQINIILEPKLEYYEASYISFIFLDFNKIKLNKIIINTSDDNMMTIFKRKIDERGKK